MTNTNHTPGPWATDEDDHDAPYQDIKIEAGKHHTICTVWIDDAPVRDFNAEQQANARLIAAAPESHACNVELAGIVRELCRVFGIPLPQASLDRSDAAIAKATGTNP